MIATLPNQNPIGEGKLNESSLTWAFILNWSKNELARARELNDAITRDKIQTAAIRGRIKLLKEIIDLPKPKEQFFDESEEFDSGY